MKESMPKHVQRGIAALVAVVLGILMLRLATQVRHLQARVEALEETMASPAAEGPAGGSPTGTPATTMPQGREVRQPLRQTAAGTHRPPQPATETRGDRAPHVAPPADAPQPTGNPETGKFRTPTLVELNSADSATLVRIPGIAGRTAQAILAYREQLGGYISPRQLEERLTWDAARERMDEWCSDWLMADPMLVRRIDVNTAPFRTLLRHPYLDYPQVQQLVRYRDRYKRIPDLETLRQLDAFTEADIARLTPYLTFGPEGTASQQPTIDHKEE